MSQATSWWRLRWLPVLFSFWLLLFLILSNVLFVSFLIDRYILHLSPLFIWWCRLHSWCCYLQRSSLIIIIALPFLTSSWTCFNILNECHDHLRFDSYRGRGIITAVVKLRFWIRGHCSKAVVTARLWVTHNAAADRCYLAFRGRRAVDILLLRLEQVVILLAVMLVLSNLLRKSMLWLLVWIRMLIIISDDTSVIEVRVIVFVIVRDGNILDVVAVRREVWRGNSIYIHTILLLSLTWKDSMMILKGLSEFWVELLLG